MWRLEKQGTEGEEELLQEGRGKMSVLLPWVLNKIRLLAVLTASLGKGFQRVRTLLTNRDNLPDSEGALVSGVLVSLY